MTTGQVAPREEVEAFLAETEFSGYQEVPLPHGLRVPGKNRKKRADQVFSMDITGRSFLDVGTSYGVFPYEAMERGAARALGLEPNPTTYAVANRISELHGRRWEIRQARVEELGDDETLRRSHLPQRAPPRHGSGGGHPPALARLQGDDGDRVLPARRPGVPRAPGSSRPAPDALRALACPGRSP